MAVPADFREEVKQAANNPGRLALLRWELKGFSWEAEGLKLMGAPGPRQASAEQAIIFTGHMVDKPDRPKPRFPQAKAELAAVAIEGELRDLMSGKPETCLGLAGGASGGDILFHEACERLGIASHLHLTLPVEPFIAASVAPAGGDWVKRFRALESRLHGTLQVLGPSEELPAWLRQKKGYNVWARTNVWMLEEAVASGAHEVHLVALWDGEAGDGIGGTKHLIDLARSQKVITHVIDTKKLFGR